MQTYQIEIDPSVLVHDGVQYEPVAFRSPSEGDKFLGNDTKMRTANCDYGSDERRLIVRPVWQWPEWLGGAAIAMDANGAMFWHEKPTRKSEMGTYPVNGLCFTTKDLAAINPSFTPPPLKPGEIAWNPKCKPTNESE